MSGVLQEESLEVEPLLDRAQVFFEDWGLLPIEIESVAWAAPFISEDAVLAAPTMVSEALTPGDVARFRVLKDGNLRLAQVPEVQGAMVSVDPQDGAITSLVGGFDFYLSNYNRAIQSKRQPGSSFKPFVYSAALENGFTAATIVNDSPIVEASDDLETDWRPNNYSGLFSGPTRLREALVKSLNLVSIRVIREAGIDATVRHLSTFGFDETALPANATLALGAGGVAPIDLVDGYATFANGGYNVDAYLIQRIENVDGEILYESSPGIVCQQCDEPAAEKPPEVKLIDSAIDLYPNTRVAKRIISAQNAYLINDMMQDVVRRGTGVAAYRELGRQDLAGKTGTTNDRRDAWFAGFNGDLVAAAWVGFDEERSLGRYEQGAATALPIWIDFMRQAMQGVSHHTLEQPPGIVDVRINPASGLIAAINAGSIFEKFRIDHIPAREPLQLELKPGILPGASDSTRDYTPGQDPLF